MQCSFIVSPQGGGKRLSLSESLTSSFNYTFKWLIHSKRYVMKQIILTLSATFKGSADQRCVNAKTDFTFLGHDNLFSQIYMTRPEGQTQVIARDQSISLAFAVYLGLSANLLSHCTNQHRYTLLSLLIFRTHAQSVKWEGRNITKKKTEIPRLLHSSVVMLVNSTVLRLSRQPYIGYQNQLYCQVCLHTQWICFRDRSYHSATEWQWQNKKTQIIKTRNKKNK